MILLDATVVNVALPSAQADLGFSNASRPWVVTAYVLAFGSLLPLGGRLGDAFGRKTMFIVGLLGFAIASAVGGAAPNIGTLIAARAVRRVRRGSRAGGAVADHGDFHRPQGAEQGGANHQNTSHNRQKGEVHHA